MADRWRTLLVDDEPAALRRLDRLCADLPEIDIVATAECGEAALNILDQQQIDLILLDIQMPGMSGLELAAALGSRNIKPAPAIVFVTAHERFAVSAFSVDAVGYLLKPVDPVLLRATVDRLGARGKMRATADEEQVLWVPHRGTLVRLDAIDIDYVAGEDDYVRLHRGASSYLIGDRLFVLADRLASAGFVRIHRSVLANERRIAGLERSDGGWAIRLKDGGILPIGRTFLSGVRMRLRF